MRAVFDEEKYEWHIGIYDSIIQDTIPYDKFKIDGKTQIELVQKYKGYIYEQKINLHDDIVEILEVKENLSRKQQKIKDHLFFLLVETSNRYSIISEFLIDLTVVLYDEKIKKLEDETEKAKGLIEDVNSTIDEVDKYIGNSEHRILTHVLTLLGVFTAVITLILSAISITNTWLQKADEVSFASAILIPSAVIIVAIIALLSVIHVLFFSRLEYKKTNQINHKEVEAYNKKIHKRNLLSYSLLVIIVVGLIGCCIWFGVESNHKLTKASENSSSLVDSSMVNSIVNP